MLRELYVSRLGGQLWCALREDGVTVELRVEEEGPLDAPVGRIIKARVTNVLPGIQSAFLDIGAERGAFLHVKELLLPGERLEPPPDFDAEDLELDEPAGAGAEGPAPFRRSSGAPIQDRLAVGRELLVQVVRERLGSKGARLTCFLSVPGRLLVLLPQARARGVSHRIHDPDERERLRGILAGLLDPGVGLVARTAAAGASESELRADAEALLRVWSGIQERAAAQPAPSVIQREPGLLLRLLQETPGEGLERIVLDDEGDRERALAFLAKADPVLASKVSLHAGPPPLLETQGLHEEVEKALRPRVWLKSGGYLIIEETEALVSIDVNTGKYVGRKDFEQTALRTNVEASREIARQLRLRDLGGIIVIDFIDVGDPANRRRFVEALEEALRADRARTKIVGLSELGLLQLTRKRVRPALGRLLTRSCPLCHGRGRIANGATVAAEALVALRRAAEAAPASFTLRVHPDAAPAVVAGLERSEFGSAGPRAGSVQVVRDGSLRPDRFVLAPR